MRKLRFGSFFAGIGGFDLAFERAGMQCVVQVEIDKNCQEVLTERFPNVPKFGDIREVGAHNLPEIDVLCGGFPCFPAGTLVLTRSGYVEIENVMVGDEVYTHNGRWMPVTSTMNRYADKTLTLKGGFHYGLRTTHEHPFYASHGRKRISVPNKERRRGNFNRVVYQSPDWVDASSMKGMYWSSPVFDGNSLPRPIDPILNSAGNVISSVGEVTPSVMWLAGAWLGDGWLRRRNDRGGNLSAVYLCCEKHEVDFVLSRIADCGLSATVDVCETTVKLIISCRAFAEWLFVNFGEHSHGKKIPAWVLECKQEYRQQLLDGYRWTDGCDSRNGWKATTIGKKLALGIASLSHSLGYYCSLYFTARNGKREIMGRLCNESDTYVVESRQQRKQSSSFRIDRHVFSKCRDVSESEGATVYNISVAEDESYVAEGVVVHNCQGLSVAGKRKGLADARSGLFWEMARVIYELRPRIVTFENVPGLLSTCSCAKCGRVCAECGETAGADEDTCLVCGSAKLRGRVLPEHRGADFYAILSAFDRLGFDGSWRILDARYFGVPQRRRRLFGVFVSRDIGDPGGLAGSPSWDELLGLGELYSQLLLECDGLRRDPAPRRGEGKDNRRAATVGAPSGSPEQDGLMAFDGRNLETHDVFPTLQAKSTGGYSLNYTPMVAGAWTANACHTDENSAQSNHLVADTITSNYARNGGRSGGYDSKPARNLVVDRQLAAPLVARQAKGAFTDPVNDNIIAFSSKDYGQDAVDDVSPTLRAQNHDQSHINGGGQVAVATQYGIRRLTPTECARLQGFPDDWNASQSNSVRYRQFGNAVAVPVVEWIGRKIVSVYESGLLSIPQK